MLKNSLRIIIPCSTVIILAISFGFIIHSLNLNLSDTFYGAVDTITVVALALFLLITVIEFISLFFDKTASVNTAIATLFMFLMVAFSGAGYHLFSRTSIDNVIEWLYIAFKIISNISFVLSIVFLIRFLHYTYNIHMSRVEGVISLTSTGIIIVLFIVLTFFNLEIIAFFLQFAIALFWLIKISQEGIVKKETETPFICTLILFSFVIAIEITDILSFTKNVPYENGGITPILAILSTFNFLAIYLWFALKTTKDAYKKQEYEKRIQELQANVLKNQIKPHFIFNALNVIKTLYMIDSKKGDEGIDLLSKHLRYYVEAGGVYLVPLNKELDNVSGYVNLENMKVEKPFDIVYNIDSYDFQVPYFSIQPFVENAIRYSGVNNKQDGYIEIKTNEDESNIYLIISDNGVGFDTSNVSSNSFGIKNASERFKLLLNAQVEINSVIGIGTKVIVKIPKNIGERK